ncbi:MAG: tetratricopeptide repeat protein [Pyrinomonadaceae bacterium]
MHRNTIAFVIVAAIAGFIGGFWLANSINRSALNSPSSQKTSATSADISNSRPNAETDLTADELRSKIAEADKNPTNLAYQKDLGTALYRYAAMKQNVDLLMESVRILERASSINGQDFDVSVALGNAHFDIGFATKNASEYQKARDIYAKALEIKPTDADVHTDLGLTYFLQDPPIYDKAAAELQRVSDANPNHQRSLQFLVQVLVKQNKLAEAEKALAKLTAINPANSAVAELTSQISAAKSGPNK